MPPRYDVMCPACGAKPEKPCRTLTTGRTTDTHAARLTAQYHRWVGTTTIKEK